MQQQPQGFVSDQQQQMIHNLFTKCSEYISQHDCFSLLSQSNWNYEWCERIMYTIPHVIFSQTLIPKELGLRLILSESNCNEETCQLYVNMVLDFAHKTNLNWYLCMDCLSQAKWNAELAFEMFQRCKHEIPENGFVYSSSSSTIAVNNNEDFQDSGDESENITSHVVNSNNIMTSSSTTASPCIGGVLLNSSQPLSTSACDNSTMLDNDNIHENTPESSPNESANILNTGRISIISNYF